MDEYETYKDRQRIFLPVPLYFVTQWIKLRPS